MRIVRPLEEEQQTIEKLLKDLAEYYGRTLTERQVEMYTEDLIEMGSDRVWQAIKKYRLGLNHDQFPLPSTLRAAVYYPFCDADEEIESKSVWS